MGCWRFGGLSQFLIEVMGLKLIANRTIFYYFNGIIEFVDNGVEIHVFRVNRVKFIKHGAFDPAIDRVPEFTADQYDGCSGNFFGLH